MMQQLVNNQTTGLHQQGTIAEENDRVMELSIDSQNNAQKAGRSEQGLTCVVK